LTASLREPGRFGGAGNLSLNSWSRWEQAGPIASGPVMSPANLIEPDAEAAASTPSPRSPSTICDDANAPRRWRYQLKKLSVLVPLCNERWTIEPILRRVLEAPIGLEIEVIVVDDASADGSAEVVEALAVEEPRLRVLRQSRNLGKGAAVRRAIEAMTGDVAVIQDADLEYDPRDYARLLQPILDGDADAVFGSRFTGPSRRVLLFWHSLGNKLLTLLANVLHDLNLSDMETCYKAVRADILRELRLTSNDFRFEPELTSRLAQWGARIFEIPVSYRGRRFAEGKKTRAIDGLRAVWELIRCRFIDTRFTPHAGMYVLRSVDHAVRYNRWLLKQVAPYLGARIAEAGAGIGSLSQLLIDRKFLFLVDHDPVYLRLLEDRFGARGNVRVQETDLTRPNFEDSWPLPLDTVFCSNVLEHLGPHRDVLASFHRALAPGGHCIIIVPAEPALFTPLDQSLGHHRRYGAEELRDLMTSAGFDVVDQRQFCKAGAAAWWLNGRVLRRRGLTPRQMIWFDRSWPLLRAFDRVLPWPGMSLICVGRKPQT
jgi:glycosyltransferase involved in cell wall biosynthesis